MRKMTGVFLVVSFLVAGCGSFKGVFSDPDVLNALAEGVSASNSEPASAEIVTYTFINESSYQVTFVVGISSFTLAADDTIPVAAASNFDAFAYSPENTVAYEVSGITVRFFDR
jgi:predicted small secreted protein